MTVVGVEVFGDIYTYIMFLVGVLGMFAHWMKRFIRRQMYVTFKEWLFVRHKRYTIYAFMTYVGSFWVLLLTGIDGTILTNWTTVFLLGYAIDSAVNDDLQRDEVDFDDFDEPIR